MKKLSLFVCLAALFVAMPVYGDDEFVIDFGAGRLVFAGERLDLIPLLQQESPWYRGQAISEVLVYSDPRRNRGGGVVLLDRYGKVLAEEFMPDGFARLRAHGRYQTPAYLEFERDALLERVEIITERGQRDQEDYRDHGDYRDQGDRWEPPGKRARKEKGIAVPKSPVEVGSFVKTNYNNEVKQFPISRGGFSKINFRVQIGEQYGVIVNTIRVLANGRKLVEKSVGVRLSGGDNLFDLEVPEEATHIWLSIDHGQGASVHMFLLP